MVQLHTYSSDFIELIIERELGQHLSVLAEHDRDSVRSDLYCQAMLLSVDIHRRLPLVMTDDEDGPVRQQSLFVSHSDKILVVLVEA